MCARVIHHGSNKRPAGWRSGDHVLFTPRPRTDSSMYRFRIGTGGAWINRAAPCFLVVAVVVRLPENDGGVFLATDEERKAKQVVVIICEFMSTVPAAFYHTTHARISCQSGPC